MVANLVVQPEDTWRLQQQHARAGSQDGHVSTGKSRGYVSLCPERRRDELYDSARAAEALGLHRVGQARANSQGGCIPVLRRGGLACASPCAALPSVPLPQ